MKAKFRWWSKKVRFRCYALVPGKPMEPTEDLVITVRSTWEQWVRDTAWKLFGKKPRYVSRIVVNGGGEE